MLSGSSLSTAAILAVFTDEVTAEGGRVTDTFHDGRRLFARSIVPHVEEVRPGDLHQGGVALKTTGAGVTLYPYVFRQVCRNGAIIAETLESRFLADLDQCEPEEAMESIREAIQACIARDVFVSTVRKMRTASEMQADAALAFLPLLSQLASWADVDLLSGILEQFFRAPDRSQFGLANAVTAVARETQDPELRWNLEEFGGGLAVALTPRVPANGGRAAKQRERDDVLASA